MNFVKLGLGVCRGRIHRVSSYKEDGGIITTYRYTSAECSGYIIGNCRKGYEVIYHRFKSTRKRRDGFNSVEMAKQYLDRRDI